MTPHFKTLIRYIPQIEPLLFVQKFTILPPDEALAKFGPKFQTAACSPDGFWFHKIFWESLPPNKQAGLILHEVMHGALAHLSDPFVDNTISRRDFHRLANIAQDIVIERSIYDINQKIQPNVPWLDRDILQNYEPEEFLPYEGLNWRQVYAKLRAEASQTQASQAPQSPVCDLTEGRGQPAELESRWDAARKESEVLAEKIRTAGTTAQGTALNVAPDEPVIPWQSLLTEFLVAQPAPVRKTWSKVKRRPFGATGAYLPSRTGTANALPSVNLLLDTSGSMSADYGALAGEVLAICAIAEQVYRVDYDVGVAHAELIEDPADYQITQLYGGGGTCLRTTLKQLLESRDFDRTVPCVVLTDSGDDYNVADLGVACVFLTYGAMFRSDAGPVYAVKN